MSTSLGVCLIGGAIYLFTWLMNDSTPRAYIAELGRLAFFAGLLAFLLGK